MRVAFFSPLPPSKSGIADYSAALIGPLAAHLELDTFSGPAQPFDPARYDLAVYQIGNNPYHEHAYETALKHPGVVVLHEANLHHLVADTTIKRGDWDAYLAECEYNGGSEALAYARRVRALEVGPDYDGLPMLRRLLERSRAVIAHSDYVLARACEAGFRGPAARIPHGAWIPEADRLAYRSRLGLDELAPLIGIFGYLKPYKRIAESLRAFKRLVRLRPDARLILVGEPHPEFPVGSLIHTLGIAANARLLGFTSIEDFSGYMAACDIILNLRYPTAGETSGSLLRALGLGRATLVSDIGAFAEFPESVCVRVPPGPGEEELIFEYLNLLVSRPEAARPLGERARSFVAAECAWPETAAQYAAFLKAVAEGRDAPPPRRTQAAAAAAEAPPNAPEPVAAAYLETWVATPDSREYLDTHASRLVRTLELTPPGGPDDRILEMGAYLQITPALQTKLGYGEVRGCYYGERGRIDHKTVTSETGEIFVCDIDHFDAERDPFPYPDGHFATVLCCELIEHLFHDPMHMMCEVNRILKPGGHLLLTTPNIAALRGLAAILQGYHPGFFHAYIRPNPNGEVDARHNREYTPREVHQLLDNSGFEVTRLETGPFREEPRPEYAWVLHLLRRYQLPADLRGDGIYAVGRKRGTVRERYPGWLYA
jgi:glycosyltransferase involved in cell wall biosynthesis/SAM-dependent methyltransferase